MKIADQNSEFLLDRNTAFPNLQNIWERDWIQRVWTFQEILLAANPVLCCGTRSLSWHAFIYSMTFLEHSRSTYNIRDISSTPYFTWAGLLSLWIQTDRPAHWNGRVIEAGTPSGETFPLFQEICLDFFDAIRSCYSRIANIHFCLCIFMVLAGMPSPVWVKLSGAPFLPGVILMALGTTLAIASMLLMFVITRPGPGNRPSTKVQPWLAILSAIRFRKSSNPKDQSYAFYGILRNLGVRLASPDYAKPLGQVYREFFIDLLTWTNSLDMLLWAGSFDLPDAPSWVPNWKFPLANTWSTPDLLYWSERPFWSVRNETEIVLRGRWMGEVLWRSQSFHHVDISSHNVFDTFSNRHNTRQLVEFISTMQSFGIYDGLWNTLTDKWDIQNLMVKTFIYPLEDLGLFKEFWYYDLRRANYRSANLDESVEEFLNILERSDSKKRRVQLAVCNDLAATRRIYFITSGGLIGTCSESVEVGDKIAYVYGVSRPLALRARQDSHQLVGVAVTGGMQRDLQFGNWNFNGPELQEITLC
jgi:hypothetical protein